jgi:hypothetical protein
MKESLKGVGQEVGPPEGVGEEGADLEAGIEGEVAEDPEATQGIGGLAVDHGAESSSLEIN